jgi:hypothetical protein
MEDWKGLLVLKLALYIAALSLSFDQIVYVQLVIELSFQFPAK